MSAIPPDSTEMNADGAWAKTVTAARTCGSVISAVMFSFTPCRASPRSSSLALSPRVLVTGIFDVNIFAPACQ